MSTYVDIDGKALTSQESVALPFGKLGRYAHLPMLTSEQDIPSFKTIVFRDALIAIVPTKSSFCHAPFSRVTPSSGSNCAANWSQLFQRI